MSWYKKYLSVYEKPFNEVPQETINLIWEKIRNIQSTVPLVSVVLIAHNEEKHLLSCLWSLSENNCKYPIEIIGINNNSTDRTEEILKESGIRVFNETKKGPGHARQCGLDHAKGKYHVCIDSDTIYPPYYIQTMVDGLIKNNALGVYSLWSFLPDENHSKFGLFIYESLRDIHLKIQNIKRPELSVRGMTFAFVTEYGRKIGFRTDIIRGEDGSLAYGLMDYGKIKFITSRKARPITSNGTLNADGSFFNSFKFRFVKFLKGLGSYFTSKDEYKDEDSNLIK